MGLKSGSRDSGLDEEGETQQKEEQSETEADAAGLSGEIGDVAENAAETAQSVVDNASEAISGADTECDDGDESASDGPDHPAVDSIPYKLRRGNVNEGREQVPYFLRPEITAGEEQLKQQLEAELDETVYKSDYREAAMVVAQRNPDLIAEVLREWGYDLPDR